MNKALIPRPNFSPAQFRGNPMEQIMQMLQAFQQPMAQWLTLQEAAEYTGLSKPLLLRCIKAGKLIAVKDGRWKIKRVALDKLDPLVSLAAAGEQLKAATQELRRRHA